MDETTVADALSWISAGDLYTEFNLWSRNRGDLRPMTAVGFGKIINGKGYPSRRVTLNARRQMVYDGLVWAQLMAGISDTPWWIMLAGAGGITLLAAAFYLLGVGLREALDPRMRERGA